MGSGAHDDAAGVAAGLAVATAVAARIGATVATDGGRLPPQPSAETAMTAATTRAHKARPNPDPPGRPVAFVQSPGLIGSRVAVE